MVIATILVFICDVGTVFGPAIGYGYQYMEIARVKSSEGFAPQVSLIILLSMTARIFFWLVKPYALPILFQAFCLYLCQIALLYQWVKFSQKKPQIFTLNGPFAQYIGISLAFAMLCGILTVIFGHHSVYIEGIGFFAGAVEATLGIPQLYKNYQRQSTEGLNLNFILIWVIGDTFKTAYYVALNAPIQLVLSAMFQLLVDLLIVSQFFLYHIKRTVVDREHEMEIIKSDQLEV